jgi:HSP20 family protein
MARRKGREPTGRKGEGREGEAPESRWELSWPLPSVESLEREMADFAHLAWHAAGQELPADVFVIGDAIFVEIDLPGVQESEVAARIEQGCLVIEASRRAAPPSETAVPARLERRHGTLRRRLPLPPGVLAARLELKLEAGVLRVYVRPEPER